MVELSVVQITLKDSKDTWRTFEVEKRYDKNKYAKNAYTVLISCFLSRPASFKGNSEILPHFFSIFFDMLWFSFSTETMYSFSHWGKVLNLQIHENETILTTLLLFIQTCTVFFFNLMEYAVKYAFHFICS